MSNVQKKEKEVKKRENVIPAESEAAEVVPPPGAVQEFHMPKHRPEKQAMEAAKSKRRSSYIIPKKETSIEPSSPCSTPPASCGIPSRPPDPPMCGWVDHPAPMDLDIEVPKQEEDVEEGMPRHQPMATENLVEDNPTMQQGSSPSAASNLIVATCVADNLSRPGAVEEKNPALTQSKYRKVIIGLSIVVLILIGGIVAFAVALTQKPSEGSDAAESKSANPFNCFQNHETLVAAINAYFDLPEEERGLFKNFPNSEYGPIEQWCFEGVEDFSGLFLTHGAKTFNADLSKWDVHEVKDFR